MEHQVLNWRGRSAWRCLTLLAGLACLAGGAHAGTIYNNLKSSFSNAGSPGLGTNYLTVRFTPAANALLTQVTVDLYNGQYYDVGVGVYLLTDADSNGRPDTLFATLPSITLPSLQSGQMYATGPFSSTLTAPVLVERGKNYWIAVHATSHGSSVYWDMDGASSVSANTSSSLTTGYGAATSGKYSFAVYGDATPEPATAALAGLSLVGMAVVRGRWSKRNARGCRIGRIAASSQAPGASEQVRPI